LALPCCLPVPLDKFAEDGVVVAGRGLFFGVGALLIRITRLIMLTATNAILQSLSFDYRPDVK
jgi:hypothetical protein